MKLTQRITASMVSVENLPNPSMEDVINATLDSEEALGEAETIDEEINTLSNLKSIGRTYLSEKETEGKLVIAPEEITEEELKNILAFSYSLAEGSGAEYSTVMPSVESLTTSKASLESLREMLSKFTELSLELLNRLWTIITDYWTLFKTRIGAVVNTSKELIESAKSLRGQIPKEKSFKTARSRYLSLLRYQGKYPSDMKHLDGYFLEFLDTTGDLLTNWSGEVLKTGNKVVGIMNRVSDTNAEEILEKVNAETTVLWDALDKRYEKGVSLLGGLTITIKRESDNETNSVGVAKRLQRNAVVLGEIDDPVEGTGFAFKTLSPEDIIDLQNRIITAGEGIFRFLKSNKLDTLSKNAKEFITQAGKKLSDESNEDELKALYDYTVAYTRWIKDPAMRLSRQFVEVSRTVQMLCNDNLKQY